MMRWRGSQPLLVPTACDSSSALRKAWETKGLNVAGSGLAQASHCVASMAAIDVASFTVVSGDVGIFTAAEYVPSLCNSFAVLKRQRAGQIRAACGDLKRQ